MRQKAGLQKPAAEHVIKDIRRATRKPQSFFDSTPCSIVKSNNTNIVF